ncbi:hypothetical protein [Microbacterium sp. No. 7]|uniref:hypothetical protein n=1 Tax=Microbacterium sp. No. 7 TaxID=1714373 RepID=UPI0006D12F50|nr:hypothetical protein [Microbacterium sp. No. 7]ALJ19501.1 hypothetical protein AOA12_06105 [Microbacterium sp. No. 7]
MSLLTPEIFSLVHEEMRQKSQKAIYRRDFAAWLSDVMGERMYGKMAEISEAALFGPKPRTFIKSANGTGKTYNASRWVMWWNTVFDPVENNLAIVTAPTGRQVEQGVFMYLKKAHGEMRARALRKEGRPWPGWISEKGLWQFRTLGGNISIAIAAVPAPQDAVSTFQGIRREGGRSLLVLDEAGGVDEQIFTAIDALTTSGEARMVGIGNPDRRATEFYKKFTLESEMAEAQLFTISAYDLPTMTGEIVYPDDPEKQAMLMKGLTSASWICHKERVWMTGGELYFDEQFQEMRRAGGTPNGRFRSKVQGEFPGDADNTFFTEEAISRALNTEIEPDPEARPKLGCDIATTGDDESVVYVNNGGRVRLFDKTIPYMDGDERRETTGVWTKEDTLTAARRIHAIAMYTNASEVRVDGNAIGSGVATDLMRLEEFANKTYEVIRVVGSRSSTDLSRWRIWRDEIHDYFNTRMLDGLIDLDPEDTQLSDELMLITYTLVSGAIKIDKKSDMKTVLGGSPDRADAAMMSVLDVDAALEAERGGVSPGDTLRADPEELFLDEMDAEDMPW